MLSYRWYNAIADMLYIDNIFIQIQVQNSALTIPLYMFLLNLDIY